MRSACAKTIAEVQFSLPMSIACVCVNMCNFALHGPNFDAHAQGSEWSYVYLKNCGVRLVARLCFASAP